MKVLMFGGTSEGRILADYMDKNNLDYTICVATDHGYQMLDKRDNVIVKRQNIDDMKVLIEEHDIIIDATHPFAIEVSSNIKQANKDFNKPYYRIKRSFFEIDDAIYFDSLKEACLYLNGTTGNILATTGSKELSPYTLIKDYQARVYFRVLPMLSSIEACLAQDIAINKIIAMQGPFSMQLNIALLKEFNCKFLITKNTGTSGGLKEKLEAIRSLGIKLIVIDGEDKSGISIEKMREVLR